MTAATYPIAIEQGATFTLSMIYRLPNNPDGTLGAPQNLTGCLAAMQIRQVVGSPVLVDLTEVAGITVGTTDGRLDVLIPEAQTILLTTKRALYDLYITFPAVSPAAPVTVRLLEGPVTVDLTITNPTTD